LAYFQNYNPLQSVFLSTLVAAGPILTLLYLLALHPFKMPDGSRHRGIAAHKAAAVAVLCALLVAIVVFGMPWRTAAMSMVFGSLFGLFPIGLIVIAAIFLYTITLVSGDFEIVKDSVASISSDQRIQAILIAFSFGAFVEGAAGFGTPVAISGALMVGLGFRPLQAAVLCLIANTAPVAYGALGTPITALSNVTGIDPMLISKMAARQLPFFSVIVPVWMTAVQVRMDRRPWRDVLEVWPVLLVAGGTFAVTQFLVGNFVNHLLVDILGGVISMAAVALFCRIWRPRNIYRVEAEHKPVDLPTYSKAKVIRAWVPWGLLTVLVFLWGYPAIKNRLNEFPGAVIKWEVPQVHNHVFRMQPVVRAQTIDKAVYEFNWLTSPGSGILLAAIVSGFWVRLTGRQWALAVWRTFWRLRLPLLTICLILGMGYITKYSGMDAVLGLAFTRTRGLYPFFAPMLGWLGVALTGSDTASNVMFGSMQKIAAEQGGFNPILIVTSNSTGGVMGKMIDAQSIVVATAACYENKEEGKLAAGPIFRAVLPHSIALAALMGLLVILQAYLFSGMIPR
jgi:lactate permease